MTDAPSPEVPEDLTHVWVIPCVVIASPPLLSMARQRNHLIAGQIPENTRLDVVDVYCKDCHRPFTEVEKEYCSAKVDNRHLRGGPADRKKRKRYRRQGPEGEAAAS